MGQREKTLPSGLSAQEVKLTGFIGTLSTNRLVLVGQTGRENSETDGIMNRFYWDTGVK